MTSFTLDGRARLSIELALTADQRNPLQHARQEVEATELRMTGAEVDAARRGWSFDVQTSIALALACTSSGGEDRRVQHMRALGAGIAEDVCREIEALADSFARSCTGEDRNHA
jgi:hypothetical protein